VKENHGFSTDPVGHTVSAIAERPPGGTHTDRDERGAKTKPRYRGRCECGATTHLAYSAPLFAKTALRRTHIHDITGGEA
jgi:hypothetical protein